MSFIATHPHDAERSYSSLAAAISSELLCVLLQDKARVGIAFKNYCIIFPWSLQLPGMEPFIKAEIQFCCPTHKQALVHYGSTGVHLRIPPCSRNFLWPLRQFWLSSYLVKVLSGTNCKLWKELLCVFSSIFCFGLHTLKYFQWQKSLL